VLPGVEPSGRRVEVAFVVVGIEDGKVGYEHIYWDQASVLVQLGLLDPAGLPVVGSAAVAKLRDPSVRDPFFGES
jgi:carboxymethylenebutenolidase